jgi:hypothetical protein
VSSRDPVGIKTVTRIYSRQVFLPIRSTHTTGISRLQKVALRKISNINQRINRPAHFARTRGLASWVMQWVCSLRDSLQGSGCNLHNLVQPYEPASHFPYRAGHIGHREAPLLHLQLFKSSTRHPSMQIANRLVLSAVSRLPENINDPPIPQLAWPVERLLILWETPLTRFR